MSLAVLDVLACPDCGAARLSEENGGLACACGASYEVRGIPIMLPARSAWAAPVLRSLEAADLEYGKRIARGDGWWLLDGEPYQVELRQHNLNTGRRLVVSWASEFAPGGSILDLGCGEGYVARMLLERDPSAQVTGIELSPLAMKHGLDQDARCRFVAGDATHLPFRGGSFDAILGTEVIEHIPDTQAFLVNVARVLKPGGRAWLTTPNGLVFKFDEFVFPRLVHTYHRFIGRTSGRFRGKDIPEGIFETFLRRGRIVECLPAAGLRLRRALATQFLGESFFSIARRFGVPLGWVRAAARAAERAEVSCNQVAPEAARRIGFTTIVEVEKPA